MSSISGADLLARLNPKLREETARICLRPDLLDTWSEANQRLLTLRAARSAPGDDETPTGPPGTLSSRKVTKEEKALAEEIQKLEADIEDAEVEFRFRAMSKDKYQAMCDMHPPRKGNQFDLMTGYDRLAVDNAAVRECMVDPAFEDCTVKGCDHTDCGSWQHFVAICNPSEWEELRNACSRANGSVTERPKSALAAQVLRNGGTVSR